MIDIIRAKRAVELFEDNIREGMSRENAAKWAWHDTRPNRGIGTLDEHFQRTCDAINPELQKLFTGIKDGWPTVEKPVA